MDMSAAALPPRYGSATPEQMKHPRYGEYCSHRRNMSNLMVDCEDFAAWLINKLSQERLDDIAKHPDFKTWQSAFIAAKAGRNKVLGNGKSNSFPNNFHYWLATGQLK